MYPLIMLHVPVLGAVVLNRLTRRPQSTTPGPSRHLRRGNSSYSISKVCQVHWKGVLNISGLQTCSGSALLDRSCTPLTRFPATSPLWPEYIRNLLRTRADTVQGRTKGSLIRPIHWAHFHSHVIYDYHSIGSIVRP